MELKEHQKTGVEIIKRKMSHLLIADEMGLGKTAMTISAIKDTGVPWIIVCPAAVKVNWCKEIKMWANVDVVPDDPNGQFYITNYERLGKVKLNMKNRNFGGVVFDEAHYLKNKDSTRHVLAKEVADKLPRKLLLTGTPMSRGPVDLASLFSIMGLLDRVFGGYWKFYKRYCDPFWTGYGWDFKGSSNKRELSQKIKPFVLKRTKKSCGIELPKKEVITLKIGSAGQRKKSSSFAEIEKDQQAVNRMKLNAIIDFIRKTTIFQRKKVVVFYHHKKLFEDLKEYFGDDALCVNGSQTAKVRQKNIDAFQNSKECIPIFCSLQASCTGITLTSAHVALFCEYLWSPDIHEQAQDRIHRISQTNDCQIYMMTMDNSIDYQKLNTAAWKEIEIEGIL